LKPRFTDLINILKNYRDRNFRNHLYIFLICCIISLFIWFLIKMSDDYVADIKVSVQYSNLPANKILNKPGDFLKIRMHANGSDLFSSKYLSARKSIDVNLNQIDLKKSRYFDKYYILGEQLRNQVSDRFDFTHNLVSISPDTLFINLEEIISKALVVRHQLEISCESQYQLYDSLVIIPGEIMVSGPSSIIDTLEYIETISSSFTNLDQTTEAMVGLLYPVTNDKVSYSDTEVKVIIPIEEFTESSIELAVQGSSDDSGISIRTFPEKVQITYQVAIKDFKLVKPEMFVLAASYDPEKDKEKTFLKVKAIKSPDFIKITRISPDKVEFIIQN